MTELAHRPIDRSEWSLMLEQADTLVKTGFLPTAINSAQKAAAVMLKARELNIPPMYGLSNIAIIQGKPVAGAELLLALIYRDHGDNAVIFKVSDDTQCVIGYKRRFWTNYQTHSFTIAQAKTAGLNGDNWRKYPAAMLRARCVSGMARMGFPDSIGGMYTPDELGASVTVNDDGEVRIVDQPALPPPRPIRVVPPRTDVDDDGVITDPGDAPEQPPAPRLDLPAVNQQHASVFRRAHSLWVACKNKAGATGENEPTTDWDYEQLLAFLEEWEPRLKRANGAKAAAQ